MNGWRTRLSATAVATAMIGAGFTGVIAPHASGATADQPNILIINLDDLRATGVLGVMPTVESFFADGGRTYPNSFASTPLCSPSRASLFTGRYGHNNAVTGNGLVAETAALDQAATFQGYLNAAGYNTALAGKYMNDVPLSSPPEQWDRWLFMGGGYQDVTYNDDGTVRTIPGYYTDVVGDHVVEYLQDFETTDDTPWLMYVAPQAPHAPSTPAPEDAKAPVPAFEPPPSFNEPDISDKPPTVSWREPLDPAIVQSRRASHLRTLMSVDDLVGRIVGEMDRLGETDRTLAIFTSDNGYLWGEHRILDKRYPYTESVTVPLWVRWPGQIAPGDTDQRLVSNVDMLPSLLEAAGVRPTLQYPLDGTSFLSGPPRTQLLVEYGRTLDAPISQWAAIRTPNEQYIEWFDSAGVVKGREYYDLTADPWQLVSLYGDASTGNDPPIQTWTQRLDSIRTCVGAACVVTGNAPADGVEFVAVGGVNTNAVQTQVLVPAGTLPGDVLVVSVARSTLVAPVVSGPVELVEAASGFNSRLFSGVWTGLADASTAGRAVTVSDPSGSYGNVDLRVAVYRGADPAVVAGSLDAAGTQEIATPVVEAAASNGWGLSLWFARSSDVSDLAEPAGVVARAEGTRVGGGHITALLGDSGTAVPSGPFGGLVATADATAPLAVGYSVVLPLAGERPNAAPVVSVSASCALLVCTLDASGSTDDGEIVSYAWDLGDGSTASGAVVEHTYAAAREYTAKVTVTDDEGAASQAEVVVAARESGVEFVAVDGVNTNAVQTQVLVPAGTLPGDVLVVSVARSTLVAPVVSGPVELVEAASGFNSRLFSGIWTGLADASTAGRAVTVSDPSGSYGNVDLRVAVYRGADPDAPVAGFASADSNYTAVITTPVVTCAESSAWAVSGWFVRSSDVTDLAEPAGVVARAEGNRAGGGHITALLADSGGAVPAGDYGGFTAIPDALAPLTTSFTLVLSPAG